MRVGEFGYAGPARDSTAATAEGLPKVPPVDVAAGECREEGRL
ncbi:hypothetical protein ACFV99_31495 [Streptomyces sp. NPDC059944]